MEIITKDGCKYCTLAKDLMVKQDVEYVESFVLTDIQRVKAGSHKTYPFIFVGDRFLGGYTELVNYFDMFKETSF